MNDTFIMLAKENGVSRILYEQEVDRLVQLRYNKSQENAILRKMISDPEGSRDEFIKYDEYVEECKRVAKLKILGE